MSNHEFPVNTTTPQPEGGEPTEHGRSKSAQYDIEKTSHLETAPQPPTTDVDTEDLVKPLEAWQPSTSEEHRNDTQPSRKKRRFVLGVAGVALTAAVAGIGWGLSSGDNNHHNPAERPVATAPAAPGHHGASAASSHEASPSASPELSMEQRIQNAEIDPSTPAAELPKVITERLSEWIMAGATPENYKKYMSPNVGSTEFVNQLVEENRQIYGKALFGSSFEGDMYSSLAPSEVSLLDRMVEMNREALTAYFATSNKAYDKEPFNAKLVYEDSDYSQASDIFNTPDIQLNPNGYFRVKLETTNDQRTSKWFLSNDGSYKIAVWGHYESANGQNADGPSSSKAITLYTGEIVEDTQQ